MSKFLKFIVHLVIFCTIISVLALTIPQFFGVYTAINDGTYEDTNLPMGSVTYAKEASLESLTRGDSILVQNQGNVYRYYVQNIDVEGKTCTVVNSASSSGEEIRVAVQSTVPKVVITVGVIGYLAAATKSIEGIVILGLAILFLIILYVIAEIWKKSPKNQYEDNEDGPALKSRKELKREEKERARQMKEEEREIRAQDKANRKEKKRKKRKTGGFIDEVYEDELELEPEVEEEPVMSAASEAHEELRKEVSAAIGDEAEEIFQGEPVSEIQEEEAVVEDTVEEVSSDVTEEPKEEIRKRAIPLWSAEQLAEKAKKSGDEPIVFEDEIAKVTFFDYSEIISGGSQEKQES